LKYVIAVADPVNERGLDILRGAPEFEVVAVPGKPDELTKVLPRAQALLVRSETKVTDAMMGQAPLLRVIGRAGMGVDNIDVEAATRRGIAVMNTPGGNTVSAAEHAIALLMALVRRIPWAAESMRRGEWDRKKFGGSELRGKVLGLVGLGRIGSHVANVARALGMDVLAHDPYLRSVALLVFVSGVAGTLLDYVFKAQVAGSVPAGRCWCCPATAWITCWSPWER